MMYQKKIGIVGLGWVGIPLGEQLVNAENTVYGTVTSKKEDPRLKNIHQFTLKLTPETILPEEFHSCDQVIITIPPSAEHYEKGVISIIKSLEKPHISLLSSTGVYGNLEGEIDEKSPTAPNRESTKKIVAVENALKEYHPQNFSIFRLAGLVGPGRNPSNFFKKRGVIPSPLSTLNIVHLRDVTHAIEFTLNQSILPEIVNVVAPFHPTKGTFYTKISESFGKSIPELGKKEEINRIIVSKFLLEKKYEFVVKDYYRENLYL